MCGRRLKRFFSVLVLSSLLFSVPCFSCFADVILTDSEAKEMLSEIQKSKEDLTAVQTELKESKKEAQESKKESQELKNELNNVENTYSELKTSYEKQLREVNKDNEQLKTAIAITGTSSVIFMVMMIVFIII